jgi:hypothetical protein
VSTPPCRRSGDYRQRREDHRLYRPAGCPPTQSSQLYGTNLVNLLKLLCKEKDGNIAIDFDDVVVRRDGGS